MHTALITNAQQRKALAVARSLGSKGIRIHASEETRFTPTSFSKYCTKTIVNPVPHKNSEKYYLWLLDVLKSNKYDILFPMDDDTLDIIIEHRSELEKVCNIPLPPSESYLIASDKAKSTMLALEAGIDCPKTAFPSGLDNLDEILTGFSYPLVIKPRKSSGSRGIRVVNNRDELLSSYLEIHKKYPCPIIQEYIGLGVRYDVCLLFNSQNRLRASFVQKELRHFPLEMGPSTMQESVLYPELIEKSLQLMSNLNWYGIVELEYMVDIRDGKLKFMEINPRFWNSLYMSILAGVDFPWLLYRLATEGDIEDTFNYRTGVKCRWSLPGDILHFIYNRDRLKMNPSLFAGKKENIYDDMISLHDPLPVAGFILACLRYVFDIDMWRLMFRR